MKKLVLLIFVVIIFVSCKKDNLNLNTLDNFPDLCEFKTDILPPNGFEIKNIGEIDFNGSIKSFQFLNRQTGYALMGSNVGGYVEVFKTTDGGQNWTGLDLGFRQIPRNMVFKNENLGIVTVHDVTGCPPPNCLHKAVILKTEDGGDTWEEREIEGLNGILYHPQFDSEGNLYANLSLDDTSKIIKSTDNGDSWEILFSSPELGFRTVNFSFKVYQNKIFVSGKEDNMLVIDTAGQILKTIEINHSRINDFEVIDENNMIAVVSGEVIKSTDGGTTWETIYNDNARMIGFDSVDEGLMILQKSRCPVCPFYANDIIAKTNNGGENWIEAGNTTSNMRSDFSDSQKTGRGTWYLTLDNKFFLLDEN